MAAVFADAGFSLGVFAGAGFLADVAGFAAFTAAAAPFAGAAFAPPDLAAGVADDSLAAFAAGFAGAGLAAEVFAVASFAVAGFAVTGFVVAGLAAADALFRVDEAGLPAGFGDGALAGAAFAGAAFFFTGPSLAGLVAAAFAVPVPVVPAVLLVVFATFILPRIAHFSERTGLAPVLAAWRHRMRCLANRAFPLFPETRTSSISLFSAHLCNASRFGLTAKCSIGRNRHVRAGIPARPASTPVRAPCCDGETARSGQ